MRTIKIYCKECEVELTSELAEIPETDLCWEEGMDIMLENNFSIFMNTHTNKKSLVVALADYNLKKHPDLNRFSGCCGSDGSNGLNILCVNNHEVATEVSDCWTGHYIEFDKDKIIIKERINSKINEEFKF
jgi:hypothetical protein